MRKLALVLAGCTGVVLLAMFVTSLATGAWQEAHEHIAPPEAFAAGLVEHAGALRLLFALDIAFIVLYSGFFAAFAAYLRERGRPFAYLALGMMLATSVLDFVEDHHLLALLDQAEQHVLPSAGEITFQTAESAVKFSVSYLALFLYGLAIPRDSKLGWALCLFLTAGTLVTAVMGYASPPEMQPSMDHGRYPGFLAGFVLAGAWLSAEAKRRP